MGSGVIGLDDHCLHIALEALFHMYPSISSTFLGGTTLDMTRRGATRDVSEWQINTILFGTKIYRYTKLFSLLLVCLILFYFFCFGCFFYSILFYFIGWTSQVQVVV